MPSLRAAGTALTRDLPAGGASWQRSTVEPCVLQSLKEEIFPLYREAMRHERLFILDHPGGHYTRHDVQEWKAVESGLIGWSNQWHLNFEWITEAVLWLVHAWNEDVNEGREPRSTWALPARVYTTTQEADLTFRHPGWLVGQDDRDEAAAAIREAFQTELIAYLDRLEKVAKERGYRQAHPSRAKPGDARTGGRDRHYIWLAMWQLGLASQAAIARASRVNRSTVERALRRVAKEVGITRRSEKASRVERPRTRRRGPRH